MRTDPVTRPRDSKINQDAKSLDNPMLMSYPCYTITNTTNRGSLWYYPDRVLDSSSYQGPVKVTDTFTEKYSSEFNATASVSKYLVEASVGFVIGHEYTHTKSVEYDFPNNSIYEIKIWGYYTRVDFEGEIRDGCGGDFIDTFSGSAYEPVGLRVRYYEWQ